MRDDLLHPRDRAFWVELVGIAWETARALGLPLAFVHPSNTGDCEGSDDYRSNYGWCNPALGLVYIVPRFRTASGGWEKRRPKEDILRTLAHELAHLRVCGHGKRFALTMDRIHEHIKRTNQ